MLKITCLRNVMKFIDFKEMLKPYTIFTINEIRKIDNGFHRRRLTEWQQKKYIKKIIKGHYIFSDIQLNEQILFEIANRIYLPSYISLKMALSYHHLTPETIYQITSVSPRKTITFPTQIGEFSYRTIKPSLFFGYDLIRYNNQKFFKLASLEKAILDYLYLSPQLKTKDDFQSLRLNSEIFWEKINSEKLFNYTRKFKLKRLNKTVNSFMEFMKNA